VSHLKLVKAGEPAPQYHWQFLGEGYIIQPTTGERASGDPVVLAFNLPYVQGELTRFAHSRVRAIAMTRLNLILRYRLDELNNPPHSPLWIPALDPDCTIALMESSDGEIWYSTTPQPQVES
jgi:hypothetical protein